MLPDQEMHNLDMAHGDQRQDFNKLEQAYKSLEDRSQHWITHLPKKRARDNTKDAGPEVILQQYHREPRHHDKKEQQTCFSRQGCIRPDDTHLKTSHSDDQHLADLGQDLNGLGITEAEISSHMGIQPWSIQKRPKPRGHFPANGDVKQH